MPSEVAKLTPKTDISSRTLLARLETMIQASDERNALRFGQLDAGHAAMNDRLDDMGTDLTTVRLSVARIEGERTAEQREDALKRAHPKMTHMRRIATWSSIGAAVTAIIAGLSAFAEPMLHALSAMLGH